MTARRTSWLAVGILAVATLMIVSSALAVSGVTGVTEVLGPTHGTSTSTAVAAGAVIPPPASDPKAALPSRSSCGLTLAEDPHLLTTANDPQWAAAVQHTKDVGAQAVADGLPASDLRLPYLGPYPEQAVNGIPETGAQIAMQGCASANAGSSYPEATGIAYDGESDRTGTVVVDPTLDANSVVGILNVNSSANFYPNGVGPTDWGAQLNVVLPNVTILGQRAYAFWVQNVVVYDTYNDSLSFVDDTWNFTTYSSEMEPSSLVSWSPNGSDYTGTWVAFSPYYYAPPPFTVDVYVNSSVNGAGDQVLWYNYTLLDRGSFYHASYDDLVFRSQVPGSPKPLSPPSFEASGTTNHIVNEGYEFDAFIGSDDGTSQLMLQANGTEQLKYCSIADCTPTHFAYANIPAAVNFGSQTGEETVGIDVNYLGTTGYLSAGPVIPNGLWNFTGLPGVAPGNTKVVNDLSVSGAPVPTAAQPYLFVFFKNTKEGSEGFGWAPDVPAWYLMPGTYRYEILLADYQEQTGIITLGSLPFTLTATLPYSPASGVYTPLWAFDNAQVAGISASGSGTIGSQYVLFNNPTSACTYCGSAPNGGLSPIFFDPNDYYYEAFPGVFLNGTHAYVDVNAPPSFSVLSYTSGTQTISFDLNFQFYDTSHVTLSNGAAIGGWPAMGEISFYYVVPSSQNPDPQADVYVWNSTDDLIMSNDFVAVQPFEGFTSPDQLVLYGGTGNTVWGNTFRDPPSVTLGSYYAGIALAESGDLIYNNNFSIDNPVVVLPYNFPDVGDCLPQCSQSNLSDTWFYNYAHDTWNVTPQPASNVAHTVNGFPLSGNVMGPGYSVEGGPAAPTQGGNFYWDFGTSPNNRSTLPYVARFYYSDWSVIYPLGCGTIQAPGAPCGTPPPIVGAYENGIQAGGDYAPLVKIPTFKVTFHETGLPLGTTWSVTLNEVTLSSDSRSIEFAETNGSYAYSIGNVTGYHQTQIPYRGTVVVSGVAQTLTQHFAASTYKVTFTETGLPHGTTWQVTLGTTTIATHGKTITFVMPNGSAEYFVSATGYTPSPASGTVTVNGANIMVTVTFT